MGKLSEDQVGKIRTKVNESTNRYYFEYAKSSDKDRKLTVLTFFTKDDVPHIVQVATKDAPNWLTNDAQFDEVVADAVSALKNPLRW